MWPQNKHSLRAGATFSPPGQGDCFMWNLQVSGVGEVENFCLPKPLQGYRNSMLVALAAESLILGVSGGWGRENDQGRKWAFVARAGCLCDLQGLRGSSQSRQPAHSLTCSPRAPPFPGRFGSPTSSLPSSLGKQCLPALVQFSMWDFRRHQMGHVTGDMVRELYTFLKFLSLFSDACSPVHTPPKTYPFIMSNILLSSGEELLVDS